MSWKSPRAKKKTSNSSIASSNILQRKCSCGGRSGLSGECAECSKKNLIGRNSMNVQPKLKVSQPNDKYEQEADRVAGMVMRMPDTKIQREISTKEDEDEETVQAKSSGKIISPLVQRRTDNEEEDEEQVQLKPLNSINIIQRQDVREEDEEETIQTKERAGQTPTVTPEMQSQIESVRQSGGKPLSKETRAFMEPRFGQDFSQIRLHTDRQANSAAKNLQARAFTFGQHIAFGTGQFSPNTKMGRHLLSHELAHTLQQAGHVSNGVARTTAVQRKRGGIITAPAPGEGGIEFDDTESDKPFTEEELIWIDDILKEPIINLIFESYDSLPTVVLHRVRKVSGRDLKGQFNPLSDIAITDKIKERESHTVDGKIFKETAEEAFKGTLLHELFHYLEANAESTVSEMILPKHLVNALVNPKAAGFPEFAFGWFFHPKSSFLLHFQISGILGFDPNVSILGTPLEKVEKDKNWEKSPMPVSGESISPEEDMSESFSLALTSERTLAVLKSNYPRRYQLLNAYVSSLEKLYRASGP